jgi:hypothetical protein
LVTWESLGVYGLLAQLAPRDLSLTPYHAALLRLADQRGARQLLVTAETYLDSAGDAKRAAAAMHIHRGTLYQRLARIEQLSGLDLANGMDRLTLHLGIKLARLADTAPKVPCHLMPKGSTENPLLAASANVRFPLGGTGRQQARRGAHCPGQPGGCGSAASAPGWPSPSPPATARARPSPGSLG